MAGCPPPPEPRPEPTRVEPVVVKPPQEPTVEVRAEPVVEKVVELRAEPVIENVGEKSKCMGYEFNQKCYMTIEDCNDIKAALTRKISCKIYKRNIPEI